MVDKQDEIIIRIELEEFNDNTLSLNLWCGRNGL